MSDIFISYKAEDRARVIPLANAFVAEGLSVWWDVKIEGGVGWRERIQKELDDAACVVVVWTRASAGTAGHFVQDEAARARRRGVYLPIALDPVEAPLGFGQDHLLELTDWRGDRADPYFLDILASVRAMVASEPRPTPLARSITGDRRAGPGPTRRWALIGGALAAPLAVAGAWWLVGGRRILEAAAPARSIAVLPFANLSGDPSQAYFSDGLTEEMISTLARLGSLQVVGRTSAFKFRDSKDDSQTIGADLGVAFILDGSVRRGGDQVRVTTELVDTRTGFERWSQTYDREMKDILGLQSNIAQAVAEHLNATLPSSGVRTISAGGSSDPAAYDANLRGRRLFDLGGDEAHYRQALAQFDAAIAADPNFAAAHTARARALLTLGEDFSGPAARSRLSNDALAAARRAVALAPNLADAQATLADTLATAFLDFAGAREAYGRAVTNGGGQADVLTRFGLFSCDIGDIGPGLDAVKRAVTLDPLNPRMFTSLGLGLIAARRFSEAIPPLRQALALSPGLISAHASIAEALQLQGDLPAAAKEYALEPETYLRLTGQAILHHQMGDQTRAEEAWRALVSDPDAVAYYQQAQIFAQWGDLDRGFAALEAAFTARDAGLVMIKSDPMVDPMRGDPRYVGMLKRLGLGA